MLWSSDHSRTAGPVEDKINEDDAIHHTLYTVPSGAVNCACFPITWGIQGP